VSERWRILDLTSFEGTITVKRGHLQIDDASVALSDVSCILMGNRTHWSGSLVHIASKYDVVLLSCDWRGLPEAMTTGWSSNTRVATRHHAQANLSRPRQKNAWMHVVRAKINGQAANLPQEQAARLRELASRVRSGDPQNIEAQAAKIYWSKVFPEGPFKRDRNSEGRNAVLNYGYTILRGHTLRSVVAAGLHPTLGIFHRNRSNTFGLADDLIEPFRPCVDHCVQQLPATADPSDPSVKHRLVEATSLAFAPGQVSVLAAINDLCQNFALYCEGDYPALQAKSWVPSNG